MYFALHINEQHNKNWEAGQEACYEMTVTNIKIQE